MASNRHQVRMLMVCDYIQQHLDETLNLEQLSQVAALSKYHFHRVFSAVVGMSSTKYIQLARLKRASYRLAFEDQLSITDIAFEASFESVEAFSRAFKRTFAQSPSQFRQQANWTNWHRMFEFTSPSRGPFMIDVDIIDLPTQRIAYLSHYGSIDKVLETVGQFITWRKQSGESPIASSRTFGIPYGDPYVLPADQFRFDVAGSITQAISDNRFGVQVGEIPGGRCAVAVHKGSHDNISDTIYALYRDWLPNSDQELRDYPCFFEYLNFIHEVDECDLVTKVYLPLKDV